jgi:hypothetical protein
MDGGASKYLDYFNKSRKDFRPQKPHKRPQKCWCRMPVCDLATPASLDHPRLPLEERILTISCDKQGRLEES